MALLELGRKPSGYYGQDRAELVERLPRPLGRVLDVGCGEGAAAGPLRAAGAEAVVGVELHPPSAERAREVLDAVHVGRAEDVVPRLAGSFDTILCYDVLEHLVDPAALLRALTAIAAPDARLHVSTPNARHVSLLRDLAVRGTFGYADYGHRDATHLRWFTRRDLAELLAGTGWRPLEAWPGALRLASRIAYRVTRGLSAELLSYQWALLAQRAP
jgi:2-polyprenyl-3-methyl-5-hydroxy-6-metoxy-1,4-benzoquinol methylase